MTIPDNIIKEASKLIKKYTGNKTVFKNFSYASGGCINNGGRMETSAGEFFIKWNYKDRYKGMFEAEARGLKILKETNTVYIPDVVGFGETGDLSFLILEFVEREGDRTEYWKVLGRQLAELHKNTNDQFGLDHDNFIGSLPQSNRFHTEWNNFFINERLEKQIKYASDSGKITSKHINRFQRLYKKLDEIFPPGEKPALIHGDLWSGNLITNQKGHPCIIDPAVYYGNREIELSFTMLFGGFNNEFYKVYDENYRLEKGFEERVDVYNLYPLMVHVNLFGGGYLGQVENILQRYS